MFELRDDKPVPAWANSLKQNGLYYEGFVQDIEVTLTRFQVDTITTFGTRKSRYSAGKSCSKEVSLDSSGKENSEDLAPSTSAESRFVSCS